MTIIIENASPLPIYEQIIQQVRAQILSGELKEGEMLPSIRALAKDLRISVITTRRAYDELEREGYIQTVAGRGSFVGRRSAELVREENLRRIEQLLGKHYSSPDSRELVSHSWKKCSGCWPKQMSRKDDTECRMRLLYVR